MKKIELVLILTFVINVFAYAQGTNDYSEESESKYAERIKWFNGAKYGMFIHFGLYSQLGGEWKGEKIAGYAEWIQARADISAQEYAIVMQNFNPENFDAEEIASLAKKAGMKYIVITTKHHEGFCLWDSKYTEFDVPNTPFKRRDILAELSEVCRKNGLKFGTYYSLIDWHHPSQQRNPTGHNYWTQWAQIQMKAGRRDEYILYMKNEIKELIENYDSDIMWFDGDWVDWWNMDVGVDLYNYIRGLKPEIIVNNRVAKRDLFIKDFGTPEQEHLKDKVDYIWEACYTMNSNWGYSKNDQDWKSSKKVYEMLEDITGKGGIFLLNIGPDGQGNIPKESIDILLEVGQMIEKNK